MPKIICPICEHHIRVNDCEGECVVCPECGGLFHMEDADSFYSRGKEE